MNILKVTFIALVLLISQPVNSYAIFGLFGNDQEQDFDLNKCDYDDFIYGTGRMSTNGNKYEFTLESEDGNDYIYSGSTSDKLFYQIQKALESAKPNEFGVNSIAIFTSMDEPICASSLISENLYISPGFVEKENAYIVETCYPESSDCWKMKVSKNSFLANSLRNNGKLDGEAKICNITYTPNNDLISYYENEAAYYGEDYISEQSEPEQVVEEQDFVEEPQVDPNILLVQYAIVPEDPSLIYKNALEGNQYHLDPRWDITKDKQGRVTVSFIARLDTDNYGHGVATDPKNMMAFYGLTPNDLPRIRQKNPKPFEDDYYLIMEFRISADKSSFQSGYLGLWIEEGELAKATSLDRERLLNAIYTNNAVFVDFIFSRRYNRHYKGK